MFECLDQKAARATSRIENGFTQLWISNRNHESNDWPWRIEFTRVASSIAHFAQHRFVESSERVDFFARTEMNASDFVNYIAQQITVNHPIDGSFENGRDNIAPVAAIAPSQTPQVGEQTRT